MTLTRQLVLPSVPSVEKQPLQISDTLTHVAFCGPEYIIHPGVEGVANLVFDIPKTARGVKGGVYLDEGYRSPRETQSIFEVQCIVSVKMSMGIGRYVSRPDVFNSEPLTMSTFSKDLVLDIPVTVVDPLAIPNVLMALPQEQVSNATPPEHFPCPAPISYPDPTPYTMYPSPANSPPPVALSPSLPMFTAYTDQNHVWLPPPLSPSPYQYISPIIPFYMHMIPPPPLPVQNLPIPRSASALAGTQPHSYSEPTISGLPNTATQHPLLPLNLAAHYDSRLAQELDLEPEEGKGERASRVTHRLHMSCRHRSVSPRSHRFPVPQSSPGRANTNMETTAQTRDLPPLPLVHHPRYPTASPSLHSPRPIPSPKMSNTSLPRSKKVEELERIAAAEEELAAALMAPKSRRKRSKNKNKGKQKQIFDPSIEINKTLPLLPASSIAHKVYLSPPEVGLSDYFSLQRRKSEQDIPKLADDDIPPTPIPVPVDRAPPTPTLTAITPARYARCNLTENPRTEEAESGLDALERRLLAEVGTQKIERIFTSPMDSRSLFAGPLTAEGVGGSVTSPITRGVTVTRNPTKGRLSPIKIPAPRIGGDDESDGLNVDSAISSLTLADGGWAMQADRRAKEPEQVHDQEAAHEAHEDRDSDERTHRAGTVGGKSKKSKSSFSGDDGREERKQRRRRRQDADDLMADSEPEDEAESRGRSRDGSMKGKKSGKKKEGHRLRKAVKGRVAAWLGNIDPDALPPEEDFIASSYSEPVSAAQHPEVEVMNAVSHAVEPKSELLVARTEISHAIPLLPSDAEAVQPDVPTSAPNPRSSGFMPITPEKRDTIHVTAANNKRQSHVNHLTQLFTRVPSSGHAPVGDTKGDTSSHTILGLGKASASIVRPSPQRAVSNPLDLGFKLSAGDAKNKIGAVKAALNDLSKVARSAVEQRSALVWSNKSGAQPLPYLHVPSPPKQQSQDPEVQYDVRSARGGRGGQVTAIAAFWAAAAKEASKGGPSRPAIDTSVDVTSGKQAAPIVAPKPVIAQRINEPLITERPAPRSLKPIPSAKSLDANKASLPVAVFDSSPKLLGLAGRTKPATKSSSVPAVVSSSLATPMLSSTASLARPPVEQPRRPIVGVVGTNFITSVEPPTKPYGPTKAKSTPDLAFGKARLRDLIRKYQERGS